MEIRCRLPARPALAFKSIARIEPCAACTLRTPINSARLACKEDMPESTFFQDPNAPSSPSAVTVITIGDEVHLPAVLQDRRQRTASEVSSGSATGQVAAANATDVPPAAASSKFPPASVPAPPLPSSAYRKVSDQADSPPPTSGRRKLLLLSDGPLPSNFQFLLSV